MWSVYTSIETDIALVLNWYYLKHLPSRYCMRPVLPHVPTRQVLVQGWYCLRSYQSVRFFDTRTNIYIPRFQPSTCPTLVQTSQTKKNPCYYLLLPSFDGFLQSKADWIQAQHHFHHHMRKKILTWLQMLKNCVQWKLTDHPNRFHAMKKLPGPTTKLYAMNEAHKSRNMKFVADQKKNQILPYFQSF